MKKPLSQMAVMNVDEGEEIFGGWVTAHIPQTGCYKLLAKKNKQGKIEWAHFIQRDNGEKKVIFRGTLDDESQIDTLLDAANKNLQRLFGVTLQKADYDAYTVDGKQAPPKIQLLRPQEIFPEHF